ncbi:MAG: choice-of-anchor Q domain-containing protein [Bythopirellula sp.]|nr:choice-of-anchor Q domain-containing protein [Bythopirellula sp.]
MASSSFGESSRLRMRAHSSAHRSFCRLPYARSLRCEHLEDRRLLALLTVTTDQDVIDFNDGQTSLREAIFPANIVQGADEIVFNFGNSNPATILLTQGELKIEDSLTITGPGAELLTIDASGIASVGSSSVFNISDRKVATVIDVSIERLTLTGAQNSAIRNQENLTLTSMTLSGNKSISGGALWMEPAYNSSLISLNVIDSTFVDNISTGGAGGAIYFRGTSGRLSIQDSVFSENKIESIEFGFGGAIYVSGLRNHVEIIDTHIENNSARNGGGVYFYGLDGDVHIIGSDISRNKAWSQGGGIFAHVDSLNIERSTINENVAGNDSHSASGGGLRISSSGEVVINESTISGNSATSYGGGIDVDGGVLTVTRSTFSGNSSNYGGAIFSQALVLENSTISGNYARRVGGGINSGGRLTVTNSTIVANSAGYSGGGISAIGLLLQGTVVASNVAPTRPDLSYRLPGITSGGITLRHSLIGTSVGTLLTEAPLGSPDTNGNLIGGPIHGIIDPLLGPLADNGGPTLTHALLPGSPAINAGDPSAVAGKLGVSLFDQRGEPFNRVFDGRIDIGAYEAQSLIVDTLVDENDGDYSPGDFSLREAIALANQIVGANTIAFDPALAGGTILLTMGELKITESVDVIGLGAELLTLDAQQQSRIFHITGIRAIVSLAGLKLTGGRTSGDGISFGGGAIYSSVASLSIEQSIITGNSTLGNFSRGGAILTSGYLTLKDTNISNNYTLANDADGGGFSALKATLIDCRLENNRTYGSAAQGGAAFLGSNRLSLEASGTQFLSNRTFGQGSGGGAIFSFGSITISGSRFENNSTTGTSASGGAINSEGVSQILTIASSTLVKNSTNGDGARMSLR